MSRKFYPPQRGEILESPQSSNGYFVIPTGADADHTTAGKVCTTSGSANTYGTATELSASLAADTYVVAVCFGTDDTTAVTYAQCQIVTGASLNVVVSTFAMENHDPPGGMRGLVQWLPYPLLILAGTRVGAQTASSTAAARDYRVSLVCIPKAYVTGGIGAMQLSLPAVTGTGYQTLPAGPAVGTSITSSATANTYGTATEISASTSTDLYIVGVSAGQADAATNFYGEVDLRYDASLATSMGKVRVMDSFINSTNSGLNTLVNWLPFPIPVPSGTRVGARTSDARSAGVAWRIRLLCIAQTDLGPA